MTTQQQQSAHRYDVIVVGGGHAGTEAALAAARMGARTLLLTHNIDTVGQMSCNPAIGGIGKSHLVREIDALGGAMAYAADCAGIQFRVLNRRKGPAVRATRAQADRALYKAAISRALREQTNLVLFQQGVDDVIVNHEQIQGVVTQMGLRFYAPTVILTVGTFLGGKIHIGQSQQRGGRAGDPPAQALAERLRELPLRVGRLKTGTPPRIDSATIDYQRLVEQPGDTPCPVMSFMGYQDLHPRQLVCHITKTNAKTHSIIRSGLAESPIYNGEINSVGPRYCPSIEDKVMRFADRDSHQIFLEPEGLNSHEVYPNGISTSLSYETQFEFVHSIVGLENCHITRPGYAIEYDYFDPRDLKFSLENKFIKGLFFAGQINGTTGYEEAAAQGLMAGINAALFIKGRAPWVPRRDESYIGVLIDDLISRGTKEPYRMFTSRAEYRLLLREDNADLRLTERGYELGLVSEQRWAAFNRKRDAVAKEQQRLSEYWLAPGTSGAQQFAQSFGQTLEREYNLTSLLCRPEVNYRELLSCLPDLTPVDDVMVGEQVSIQAKYAGYIVRQQKEIAKQLQHEHTHIPETINYQDVAGLSAELKQKFIEIKPATIAQAKRIPGITPAAISLILIHIKRQRSEHLTA